MRGRAAGVRVGLLLYVLVFQNQRLSACCSLLGFRYLVMQGPLVSLEKLWFVNM